MSTTTRLAYKEKHVRTCCKLEHFVGLKIAASSLQLRPVSCCVARSLSACLETALLHRTTDNGCFPFFLSNPGRYNQTVLSTISTEGLSKRVVSPYQCNWRVTHGTGGGPSPTGSYTFHGLETRFRTVSKNRRNSFCVISNQ